MRFSAVILILFLQGAAWGFAPNRNNYIVRSNVGTSRKPFCLLHMSEQEDDAPKQSQIPGNQRPPTAEELEIMDEMIMKMSKASIIELSNAVRRSLRVVSSPRFFVRIVELMDLASDEVEKKRLSTFVENLSTSLNAVLSNAELQLDERAQELESVVKAAAEPDSGEFLVPLTQERVQAMREAMMKVEPECLDEGFLSTVDMWMNKSHKDGMDGMVGILQKVLQLYAGLKVSRERKELSKLVGAAVTGNNPDDAKKEDEGDDASQLLEKLLAMDTDLWGAELSENADLSKALTIEVQRTMEAVVLGMENGSMAQKVIAEYLRELVTRIETVTSPAP